MSTSSASIKSQLTIDKKLRLTARRVVPAALLIALSLAPVAQAKDQGFYKGRTVDFVVGYDVGNGYDDYARLVARHIGKHIPGHPAVVVQNMPGAGSLTAINYLYNVAPKDGTVLGMIDQASPLVQVLYPAKVHGDISKFNWIGRVTDNTPVLYAWHTAPVKTIRDAFNHELIVAASGQNSRMISNVMKNLLGLKLEILTGYKGAGEARLAMERGEVQALTQPWPVLRSEEPKWIQDGTINILLQIGLESHPALKKVPLIVDLARNDEQRRILKIMAGSSKVGRSVMSPPGEPADRVATLRAAFEATVKDPEFLADAKKSGLDINPMSGVDLQGLVDDMTSAPAPLVAKIEKLVASKD